MLDRQLDTLAANGVDEVVVVTGFRDDQIEAALARRVGGPRVRTVFNPFYKVADNLGSLFVAREELAGDVLVWNGDTLVSDELMARVLANRGQQGICVTIDRKDRYDDDDMKVIAADDGRLRAIGKRIAEGVNAESIGLLAFRGDGAMRFRAAIERAMRTSRGDDDLVPARDPPPSAERRGVDLRHRRRAVGRGRLPRGCRRRRGAVRGVGRGAGRSRRSGGGIDLFLPRFSGEVAARRADGGGLARASFPRPPLPLRGAVPLPR